MKRRKIIVRVLVWILLIGLVLLAPVMLKNQSSEIYQQWLRGPETDWQGILHVWHIVDWKTGGSGTTWLKNQAKAFENQYPGVFIEIEAMSVSEAEYRLQEGKMPQMYSFPLGWGDRSLFQKIEIDPGICSNLANVGKYGDTLAVPYMMSGYMLLLNQDIADEREIELPETAITAEWLAQAVDKMTFAKGKGKKETKYPGLVYSNPSALIKIGLPTAQSRGTLEQFMAGKAGLAVGDIKTYSDLLAKEDAGKGIPFNAYALAGFTDEVQLAALAKNLNESQLKYSVKFIEKLLEQKAQANLAQIFALPVISSPDPIYSEGVLMELEKIISSAIVPNSFGYKERRQTLLNKAEEALSGNKAALRELEGLMNSLSQPLN